MTQAANIMARFNPNANVMDDGGNVGFREDVTDPDGRMYQVGYLSTRDGRRAVAYCLYNPWGGEGRPNAGEEYVKGHVAEDGFLCVGSDTVRDLESSPYDLDYTVRRARYWCTGFSVFKETGSFPNP